MKKIIYLLIVVFLMASVTISCKKDGTPACELQKIYYSDSFAYNEIVYDGDVVQKTYYKLKNGTLVNTTNYTYAANGNLSYYEIVDTNGITNYKYEFIYNAQNQVTEENYYVRTGGVLKKSSYWVYEYNTDGFLKNYIYYIASTVPFVNHSQEYTEFNSNGDFTKGIYKNNLGVTTYTLFNTYDNHPNPFKIINPADPKVPVNNIIEERFRPTVGGTDDVITTTVRYNDKGYLIYSDDNDDDYTFEYDCDN